MPVRPEVARQIARDRLERRLGDAHPVVDRPRHGGVEVESDDARAAGHQRCERTGQRLEREGAGLERLRRRLRRRGHEATAERVLGRERDRVQRTVNPAPGALERLRQRGEVLGAVDVKLEHLTDGVEFLRCALGHAPHPAEAREHDLGTLPLRLLSGVEGDRVLGDDAGDQQALAGQDHVRPPTPRSAGPASVRSAQARRSRVRDGSTISSTKPDAAAASARRCSSA